MNTSRSAYYQTRAFSITLGGQAIKIISKPGIPDWDDVSSAQQLLADAVKPTADARMLPLGCGPGALGAALARQAHAGVATLLDSNWISLAMAERTFNANNVTNVRVFSTISLLPEQAGTFDIAMIVVPMIASSRGAGWSRHMRHLSRAASCILPALTITAFAR